MIPFKILPTIAAFALFALLYSCDKACSLPDDVDSGLIVQNAVIFPSPSYFPKEANGDYLIDAEHPLAQEFKVRFGQGKIEPVDFSKYYVLHNPSQPKCNAQYERAVTVDDASKKVLYKVLFTECPNCSTTREVDNYVLVNKFPKEYEIEYVVEYKEKE